MLDGIWNDGSTSLQTPSWITADIPPADLAAIHRENLENTNVWGSRVAPVAQETMAEHGSDVLNFITDRCGRLPEPPENTAWRDMATFYLRHAVSQWADEAYHIL